jgi:hypothetical protein
MEALMPGSEQYAGGNTGHGHVFERPDGIVVRCGGPAMCKVCAADGTVKATGVVPGADPLEAAAKLLHENRYSVGQPPWTGLDPHTKNSLMREVSGYVDAYLELQDARPFQYRVHDWMLACFGQEIAADEEERNHRFLEEALELVQACGCTESEAHQLVAYVFGRPVGEKWQEVGGVVVTLAALCTANMITMDKAGENELSRIWTMVEQIRAKQAAKPAHSPLPAAPTDGWIEWKGGRKGPHQGATAVDVSYNDDDTETNVPAGLVDWQLVRAYRLATAGEGGR